jgi:hypothetical protein
MGDADLTTDPNTKAPALNAQPLGAAPAPGPQVGPAATKGPETPEAPPGAPEAVLQPEPTTLTGETFDAVAHEWLYGRIAGGLLGRNTDCWNILFAELPNLKLALFKGD